MRAYKARGAVYCNARPHLALGIKNCALYCRFYGLTGVRLPPPRRRGYRRDRFSGRRGFASQAMVRSLDLLLPQIAADFGTTVGVASIVVIGLSVMHGYDAAFHGADRRPLRKIFAWAA